LPRQACVCGGLLSRATYESRSVAHSAGVVGSMSGAVMLDSDVIKGPVIALPAALAFWTTACPSEAPWRLCSAERRGYTGSWSPAGPGRNAATHPGMAG